jgi:hypothetical protein
MFLSGLLCSNLVPGYLTTRHLVARVALTESLVPSRSVDAFSLLRRIANERVGALIQDVEIVLRRLLVATLERHPHKDWRSWLASKKSDDQFVSPALQKALLEWISAEANESAGQDMRQKLSSFLTEQRRLFDGSHSLWVKLCERWGYETGLEREPTPIEGVGANSFNVSSTSWNLSRTIGIWRNIKRDSCLQSTVCRLVSRNRNRFSRPLRPVAYYQMPFAYY